jgi:hypothetical protein
MEASSASEASEAEAEYELSELLPRLLPAGMRALVPVR